MNEEIPGLDRDDLSCYALAHMYRAMRKAEQAAADYVANYGHIGRDGLDNLVGDNIWNIRQATMYAAVFTAAEVAKDSPRYKKLQAAIEATDAFLSDKQIPRQRVSR